MKKIIFTLLVIISAITAANAQGWSQDRKAIYNVTLGGTQGIWVGDGLGGGYGYGAFRPLGLAINHAGEFKVHKWVGVGYQTGLNFYFQSYGYFGGGTASYVSIPLLAKANFHILEASSAKIKNKLDVYAGLTFGGGPVISMNNGGGKPYVAGIIHVGPQAGVRYWFTPKVAIQGEVGWGAQFANVGVTF